MSGYLTASVALNLLGLAAVLGAMSMDRWRVAAFWPVLVFMAAGWAWCGFQWRKHWSRRP